jgi:hypothetical protein
LYLKINLKKNIAYQACQTHSQYVVALFDASCATTQFSN